MKLSVVGWGWFVCWGWSMISWGFVDWFVGIVTWGSLVCYFNNISGISVSSVVLDNLGTAIREDYTVFTISRVTISSFVGSKVDSSIFIGYGVFVLVLGWDISVSWCFVGWSVVSWSWLVYWGWLVNWGWVVYWSWGCVVYWGWLVGWSRVAWGMSNSVAVSGRVTVLYCSMAFDFSISNGQEGNKSDEGLQIKSL